MPHASILSNPSSGPIVGRANSRASSVFGLTSTAARTSVMSDRISATVIFRSPHPDVPIPDVPYSSFILRHARDRADRPVLVDGPSGRTLTQGQVTGGARRMAAGLARRGFTKRDVVAICSPNLPEYALAFPGRPKGVMLTHRNLVAVTRQVEAQAQIDETWRTLGILPFFHIYGQAVLMNFPLYLGGLCVTMPRFDLTEFLRLIQEYRLTHLYVVPPIVLALAKHPLVDLSSLRLVGCGAAPLDEGLQRACAERLGCLVTQGYGMTETSLACHTTPQDPARVRRGSVGLTLTNMESKIIDVVTGAALPAGERGEVCVCGAMAVRGYWDDPGATARHVDPEGRPLHGDA